MVHSALAGAEEDMAQIGLAPLGTQQARLALSTALFKPKAANGQLHSVWTDRSGGVVGKQNE